MKFIAMIIEANGVQLYFEERGDGEPLLLHGGTGIGADWQHVFTDGDHHSRRGDCPLVGIPMNGAECVQAA